MAGRESSGPFQVVLCARQSSRHFVSTTDNRCPPYQATHARDGHKQAPPQKTSPRQASKEGTSVSSFSSLSRCVTDPQPLNAMGQKSHLAPPRISPTGGKDEHTCVEIFFVLSTTPSCTLPPCLCWLLLSYGPFSCLSCLHIHTNRQATISETRPSPSKEQTLSQRTSWSCEPHPHPCVVVPGSLPWPASSSFS